MYLTGVNVRADTPHLIGPNGRVASWQENEPKKKMFVIGEVEAKTP